jgi:CelD/BcsL family acetyltransferase involved in cellulose biosynthesis
MEYSLIRSPAEMDGLGAEWNALLAESASHVPFLRHDYLRIWYKTLGGGEWQLGELAIVVARDKGRLAGIAPFFLTRNREGEPALMLLGSIEISDYLDLIVREADTQAFVSGLLDFLEHADLPEWHLLDLYNILDSSSTLDALEKAAAARGWIFSQYQLQHSPYIDLPGDWETYLAGIDKKQRHEIRRKLRRIEESPFPVSWYIVQDDANLDAEIDDFLRLMINDAEKAGFMTGDMHTTFIEMARCAFREKCLNLSFLEINGQKAAACFSFDYLNRIWLYNSGMDPQFMEYSPGWILTSYLLRWANENKREQFDFMRGNEDYKYRFGAVDRFVMRATLRKPA